LPPPVHFCCSCLKLALFGVCVIFSTSEFHCPTLIPACAGQSFDSRSDFAACLFSRWVSLDSRYDLHSPKCFSFSLRFHRRVSLAPMTSSIFAQGCLHFCFVCRPCSLVLGAQACVVQGFFPPLDFIAVPVASSASVRSGCFPLTRHDAAGQISLSGFLSHQ
jgi:hypothetical protein